MAPKKKGSKKQQDDWEADLGESIDPIAQAEQAAQNGEADQTKPAAEDDANGDAAPGGLLAALRKNKNKRQKKGKADNDFVEGEDPAADDSKPAEEIPDLSAKAPEEGTFDDEDEYGLPGKKGKGGKKSAAQALRDDDSDDNDSVASGTTGVKSKKEKEKEKKEREKQRKKEQVGFWIIIGISITDREYRLLREKRPHQQRRLSPRSRRSKRR